MSINMDAFILASVPRQDRLAPFKPPPPPEKHGSVEPDQILTENRFPAEKAVSAVVQSEG